MEEDQWKNSQMCMFDSLKNGKNKPSCGVSNRFSGNNEDVSDDKEEDNISGEMLKILLRVFDIIYFIFQNR